MERTLRLLLIGAGKMGKAHAEVFNALPEVEIVGVVSRGGRSAKLLAEQFNIPYWGTDWKEIALKSQPDTCVTAIAHLESDSVVKETISAGLHTLAEKPVSLSSKTMYELSVLATQKDVIAMAAVNRRFYPSVLSAIEVIKFYGSLRGLTLLVPDQTTMYRAMGTYDEEVYREWVKMNTIHGIDLLRLAGGEIEEVQKMEAYYSGERSFTANLKFESGALGNIISHNNSGGMNDWKLILHGEGVTVTLDSLEKGFVKVDGAPKYDLPNSKIATEFKPGMVEQATAFVQTILQTREIAYPASDLADHAKTLELIEQLTLSM